MSTTPDLVVHPPIEVDAVTVETFELDLQRADPAQTVHVDCSAVTFMDSAGLRVLTVAYKRHLAAGGRFVVVHPSPPVQRLLELTALDGLLLNSDPPTA